MTTSNDNREAVTASLVAGWIRDDVFAGRDAGESLYPVSERLAERIVAALSTRTTLPMTAELVAKARKAAKRAEYYQSGEAELFTALADALTVANADLERLQIILKEAEKR